MANTENQNAKPKAMLWLESSVTALHTKHMAQLSRSLQDKGFEVLILTSEDTIKYFKESGGKLTKDNRCDKDSKIDFGRDARFLPTLASQTTYNLPAVPKVDDRRLTPFEFIGSDPIKFSRQLQIKKSLEAEKPDVLVTSLWPGGYGPFTKEVTDMIDTARQLNPNCKVYSLSNDIPYLDFAHNSPELKSVQFKKPDRIFVRGDGSIPLDEHLSIKKKVMRRKVDYVGHFVDPLPQRNMIPHKHRSVLVTYGTRESNWSGDRYSDYFNSILKAAPLTELKDHPWDLVIGPNCPAYDLELIQRNAKRIAREHGMQIRVRQGRPDDAFRQATADAAFRIAQYDPFVLDDISSGVPAMITTGNIGRYTCGSNDGENRMENLTDQGAPVAYFDQYQLQYPDYIAEKIKRILRSAEDRSFELPLDAPDKVADKIAQEYRARLTNDLPKTPDPVVKADQITPQGSPDKRRGRNA